MPRVHVAREPHRLATYPAALRAGAISVGVGLVILAIKFLAWFLTGSTALLADAADTVVNVICAAMATYSVAVAARPADEDHPYGHGKAEPLSAAVEGALVVIAAMVIVIEAIRHIILAPQLEQLGVGIAIAAMGGLGNLALGLYLVRVGRREGSEAIQADGVHILADVVITAGAIAALIAVRLTGIQLFDPLVALAVAASILVTGWRVVRRALKGLLDEADLEFLSQMARHLERERRPEWVELHELRARRAGSHQHIDVHLTVPRYHSIEMAHQAADTLERSLLTFVGTSASAVVHLDPCLPRHCAGCAMEGCPVRSEPLKEQFAFDLESLIKPGIV
jgi:cation diffusion facilitator family transporter